VSVVASNKTGENGPDQTGKSANDTKQHIKTVNSVFGFDLLNIVVYI
jgi:hypothetical protein